MAGVRHQYWYGHAEPGEYRVQCSCNVPVEVVMRPTDVTSSYITFTSGQTSEEKVLDAGIRGRLFSVQYLPAIKTGNGYKSGIEVLDGSGGSVLYKLMVGPYTSVWGYHGSTPCQYPLIPRYGILFEDGLYAKGVGTVLSSGNFVGIRSATFTYQVG